MEVEGGVIMALDREEANNRGYREPTPGEDRIKAHKSVRYTCPKCYCDANTDVTYKIIPVTFCYAIWMFVVCPPCFPLVYCAEGAKKCEHRCKNCFYLIDTHYPNSRK